MFMISIHSIMGANVISYDPVTGIYVVDQYGSSQSRDFTERKSLVHEKTKKERKFSRNQKLLKDESFKQNLGLQLSSARKIP